MSAAPADLYRGRENLEAMEAAVKYNRSLVALVAAHLRRGERILDFGAGTGTITQLLREDGFEILAVEPDPELAGQLERRGIAVERHLASLDEGTVAAVVSFNVLEHVEDDAAVLRALHGKLRTAGRLLVYVPAFPLLYSSMDRRVGHVRRYRRRALAALLERTGYRVDSVRHVDTLGFFAALAYRLLARTDGMLNPRSVRTYDRFVFPVSRWIDRVTAGALGKNLFAVCTKQAPQLSGARLTPAFGPIADRKARLAGSFFAFACAGAVGFIIEAVILTGLMVGAAWSALPARAVSFPAAVTATWALNRHFAFAGRSSFRRRVEYAGYLAIQIAGACANFAAFAICLAAFPELATWPFIPLAAGAGIALAFNFAAARTMLYSRSLPDEQHSTGATKDTP